MQPDQQVIRQRNFGSWNYTAVRRVDGHIAAGVRYDDSSINALVTYAAANQVLATELAGSGGEAEVHITFRNYVAPDQFRTWATAMGLQIKFSQIRYVSGNNNDAAITLGGTVNDPLPRAALDRQLQEATENEGVLEVRGVFYTLGTVSANRLPLIAADPLIFLADVTTNVVRNDLIAAGISGAEQAVIQVGSTSTVFHPSPFWRMEHDFGLGNFVR
jgi:hypothetical protein